MRYFIDAHAHLEEECFDEDREELIARLPKEGVLAVINLGCDLLSSKRAVENASRYDRLFACVGTHPHEARFYTETAERQYAEWTKEKKVLAIGEIGLDYHYELSPKKVQQEVFERQLVLAESLNVPVVIHTREAIEDTYDILKAFGSRIQVLMHSFNEELEAMERFLEFGYFFSLGGMVTFKNAKNPKKLVQRVPEDRLLLETDAPYLAPVPMRGKRNEPSFMQYTIEEMARLREEQADMLAKKIVENTICFYRMEEYRDFLFPRDAFSDR